MKVRAGLCPASRPTRWVHQVSRRCRGPGSSAGPPGEQLIGDQVIGEQLIGEQVIIGPVVTGPTIPVVPAGTDFQEPHTEMEDRATIPHPGSVEINTYRALRQDTRRHARRRIGRLAAQLNPDRNRDTGPAAAERDDLDRHYRAAQRRRRPAPDTQARRPALPLLDQSEDDALPEDPPF